MTKHQKSPTFVDAFAGCGGLSLGLLQAGLSGRFAIEQNESAFETFKANLLQRKSKYGFTWPRWLPKEPIAIERLITKHRSSLEKLMGTIDVLAGGPPCQGFSTAGRRRHDDPRNQLFKSYVRLMKCLEPKIVLIENVRGFTMDFRADEAITNYSDELCTLLSKKYQVHERLIDLSTLGVPQQRVRYFMIALDPSYGDIDPFLLLANRLPTFLRKRNLQAPVSAAAAISDFEISRAGTRPSIESAGFLEICSSKRRTQYQKSMADGAESVTDLRLARHSPDIAARFAEIIEICHAEGRLNTSVSAQVRERYGLKKQALRVLDPDRPSPTITSMPDDLLHYKEARTLTVRENARLQSFPDWFTFKGKYTTGGERRRVEVPRFTQVANAVPPLAARAIGEVLVEIANTRRIPPLETSLRDRSAKRSVEIAEALS